MILKPTDVIFTFRPWDPVSEVIAFFTFPVLYKGVLHHLSHAETIGKVIDDDNVMCYSADASGLNYDKVQLSSIPFWVGKTCPSLTDTQSIEILRWLKQHQGVPYNFLGLLDFPLQVPLDQKNALYCSQSVYYAYALLEDKYFNDPKTDGKSLLMDAPWVSPAHLYTSPYLIKVAGN